MGLHYGNDLTDKIFVCFFAAISWQSIFCLIFGDIAIIVILLLSRFARLCCCCCCLTCIHTGDDFIGSLRKNIYVKIHYYI